MAPGALVSVPGRISFGLTTRIISHFFYDGRSFERRNCESKIVITDWDGQKKQEPDLRPASVALRAPLFMFRRVG
jgi:hypothetical protein